MAGIDVHTELRAHGALVAYHVGPGAAEAGRTHCLMGIHHDVVLCCLNHGIVVVVDEGLAVVMLSIRDDVAHISALYGVVAILIHKIVCSLHMTLVVHRGRRTLMVHDDADTLVMGILVKGRKVKVRIRSDKVKDIVLLGAEPVFPAFVPAFNQDGVKSVLRGKVNVHAHILVVGAMAAVGLGLGVIRNAKLHRGEVGGI